MQTFSVVVDTVMLWNVISFLPMGNVFCLPLLVGHSSRVPAKRKKGIEENETVQPAGTVHEL